jgi:hypothetical protein
MQYDLIRKELVGRINELLTECLIHRRRMVEKQAQGKDLMTQMEMKLNDLIRTEQQRIEGECHRRTEDHLECRKRAREWQVFGEDLLRNLRAIPTECYDSGNVWTATAGSTGGTDYGGGYGPPWKGIATPWFRLARLGQGI